MASKEESAASLNDQPGDTSVSWLDRQNQPILVLLGILMLAIILAVFWLFVWRVTAPISASKKGSARMVEKGIRANDMAALTSTLAAILTLVLVIAPDSFSENLKIIFATAVAGLAITSSVSWFVGNRFAAKALQREMAR